MKHVAVVDKYHTAKDSAPVTGKTYVAPCCHESKFAKRDFEQEGQPFVAQMDAYVCPAIRAIHESWSERAEVVT